jgi:hypothetical protein
VWQKWGKIPRIRRTSALSPPEKEPLVPTGTISGMDAVPLYVTKQNNFFYCGTLCFSGIQIIILEPSLTINDMCQHSPQFVTLCYNSAHRPTKNVTTKSTETFISVRKTLSFLRRSIDTTKSFIEKMIIAACKQYTVILWNPKFEISWAVTSLLIKLTSSGTNLKIVVDVWKSFNLLRSCRWSQGTPPEKSVSI